MISITEEGEFISEEEEEKIEVPEQSDFSNQKTTNIYLETLDLKDTPEVEDQSTGSDLKNKPKENQVQMKKSFYFLSFL